MLQWLQTRASTSLQVQGPRVQDSRLAAVKSRAANGGEPSGEPPSSTRWVMARWRPAESQYLLVLEPPSICSISASFLRAKSVAARVESSTVETNRSETITASSVSP